jgi:hypothetical protein
MNLFTEIPDFRSDEFQRAPAFWSTCIWLMNAGFPFRQSVNTRAHLSWLRSLMNRTMGVYVFDRTMLDAADHVGLRHHEVRGVERFAISSLALRDLERWAERRLRRTGQHHAHRPYMSEHLPYNTPPGHWSLRRPSEALQ